MLIRVLLPVLTTWQLYVEKNSMITSALVGALVAAVTWIISLFPDLETDGIGFAAMYVYPAYKGLLEVPVLGAFMEVIFWIAAFEVMLFIVSTAISIAVSIGLLKGNFLDRVLH